MFRTKAFSKIIDHIPAHVCHGSVTLRTKFELVIDRKGAVGHELPRHLTVPQSLFVAADEVIE